MIEIVILLAIPEVPKSLTDGGICKRTDPETVERLLAAEVFIEVAENKLSLTSGIGGDDDALAAVEQLSDNLDLCDYSCIWLIAILSLHLSWHEDERARNHGDVLGMEAFHSIRIRHGWLHKVSESPCHIVAVAVHIAFLTFGSPHDVGDFLGYTWFLCDDCLHFLMSFCDTRNRGIDGRRCRLL